MTTHGRTTQAAAMMISLCAGGMICGTATLAGEPDPSRSASASDRAPRSFCLASELVKRDVVKPNGDSIGNVQDCLVDRGTGRILYTLVRSGDVLGLGGRTVAIPTDRFRFDEPAKHLVLDMTKEQLKSAAEFVPENWRELRQGSWTDDMDWKMINEEERAAAGSDPYLVAIAAATDQTIKGQVIDVRREYPTYNGQTSRSELVVIQVRTDDGKVQSYVLGPSWYVMGNTAAPMRGDQIEARVRALTADANNPQYIVTQATVDGTKVDLRDASGKPLWVRTPPTDRAAGETAARGTGRLVYLTDIVGAKAGALDKDGGEINDAIIETGSGQIALLCFDPNNNFLGMGDTVRCIPWSVANLGSDGKVRFDATQQMLTSAMEMPDDISTLSGERAIDSAYRTFDVRPPRFINEHRTDRRPQ